MAQYNSIADHINNSSTRLRWATRKYKRNVYRPIAREFTNWAEKIKTERIDKFRKLSDKPYNDGQVYTTADTRDKIVKNTTNDVKQKRVKRKDQVTKRIDAHDTAAPALKINEAVTKTSQTSNKIKMGTKASGAMKAVWSNKIARRSIYAVGSVLAFNLVGKAISGFSTSPAIPKDYERRYDEINKQLSDFGSPVNLAKVAAKVITPYHSTIRNSTRSTVQTVIAKNVSLFAHSKAIGHTRY